jgi:hypothetical protein
MSHEGSRAVMLAIAKSYDTLAQRAAQGRAVYPVSAG